ncbi:MAG: hypothetical protein R3A11_09345 [Bdellovibrionota bacterium]
MIAQRNQEGMELVVDQQVFSFDTAQSNQLIRAARMNTWPQFKAMLEKKSGEDWSILEARMDEMEKNQQWRLKETIARFSTFDE